MKAVAELQEPAGADGSRPLSIRQERVWLLHQLHPGNPVFTVAELVAVTGPLHVEQVRAALCHLAARHESLRCVFPAAEGRAPRAVVLPKPEVSLEIAEHEAAQVPQERTGLMQRWAAEVCRRPFDVGRGPLWRAAVASFGPWEHALLLCAHQLVADRRSLQVLLDELAQLCAATAERPGSALSPTPPLRAVAADERQRLAEPSFAAALDAWAERLAGAPAGIDLPADRLRPPLLTFSGGQVPVRLDRPAADAVEALAEVHATTADVVLLTAFAVLVHRCAGAQDVVIGLPERRATDAVGPLTNTLVLRADLSGDPSFSEALERVRRVLAEAEAHAEMPFELLVDRLQPERDLSQRPVCPVGFEVRPAPACRLPGATISPVLLDPGTAAFDLALVLLPGHPAADLLLEYDADLLERDTVERLAGNLQTLLASAAAKPSERIGLHRLLAPEEERRLVAGWNDTAVDFPRDRLVHALIAEQAMRRPDAMALVAGDQQLTFGELNRRANQVANLLCALMPGPHAPVGVFMRRCADMVVAVLGVLKAGRAAVLLDPVQPTRRLGFMLEDSSPLVLLTTEDLLPRLPGDYGGQTLCLDRDRALFARAGDADPPERAHWESTCQIAYTSGSTGEPRGVAFRQGAVLLVSHGTRRACSLTDADRGTWVSAPGFGISFVNELWPFLTAGAVVHIADETTAASPFRLRDWMLDNDITVTMLTKVLAERVCTVDWPQVAPLRILMVSGERVGWLPATLPFEVVAIYGSTETTNATTCLNEADGVRLTPKSIPTERRRGSAAPVGRPVPNARVYILDGRLQPLPAGVTGEIFVGGDLIQSGYLNRPDATAAKWLPDPFAVRPGARMVATGDLGRTSADGTIEVLGRADEQVSLNGYRIELGEVSSRLREHPAVRQVAVVVREDQPRQHRLVAYVVAEPNRRPTPSDLRDLLKEQIPAYMVPAVFVMLDTLPLLPNGKVDRRALPAADASKAELSRYVAPRTPMEEALADVWQRVLRQGRVGVHDNYFELGGDSLTGMELMASIRSSQGIDLPLRVLFEAPTVEEMAAAVERARGHGAVSERDELPPVAADPAARFEPFPLTDIQHAYWVGRVGGIELGDVGCHGYQEWDVPDLDAGRLERAVDRLVGRHDMLRAVMTADGLQRVLEEAPPYEIVVTDLRALHPEERAQQLGELRERLSHQVLPADRWPLFRVQATLVDDVVARVHVSFDLLIFDARSARIFTQELGRLYIDPDLPLPPLELSFRDYVVSERRWQETSPRFRAAREYWQGRLADLPPAPELPYVQSLGTVDHPRFARHAGRLEPEAWRRLRQMAANAGVTPSALLLAAFAEVLATWSTSPRFTINLTLFNRPPLHPQLNDILGDFTSGLLLAVEDEGETFEQRARAIQSRLWQDLEHRSVSSIQVMRDLARTRGTGLPRASMPVVFSSLVGVPRMEWGSLGTYVHGVTQTPQVSLDHQVMEVDGGLDYCWDAVTELFPEGVLDDMVAAYGTLLDLLASEPAAWRRAQPVALPAAQLARRAAVNATDAPVPAGLLHEPFLRQAAARPDALAVAAPRGCLTYGQLDRLSAAVAARLASLGVGPGRLVGVVMHRGWEQVAAVMGVLRAGAAYLPVDPELPVERIRYLLANGAVEVVLTQPGVDGVLEWPASVTPLRIGPDDLTGPGLPPRPTGARPDDLAYVIYTSGSTGAPKGVMIQHRAALNTIADVNRRFEVAPGDRLLAVSSLSFDLSVWDIFGVLGAGGTVVMPAPSRTPDPEAWYELMDRHGVTIWSSVPALLQILIEHARGRGRRLPPALRLVMLSGDWIPLALCEQVWEMASGARLVSLGGATEASIWSIVHEVETLERGWTSVPYGRPLANQRWHVLDGSLQPRPDWVTGGLYIAGEGLASGYWRDEQKTAERFVDNPHTGERLYRTGDLGRYRPSGDLEILGREDFQVKIRGNRVELGEVEAALAAHPEVASCCVVAAGDPRGVRRLVAHVVPEAGTEPRAGELREFLGDRLPAGVVPALYNVLPALPLTANGKVDRNALMALGEAAGDGEGAEPPATPREELLVGILTAVLGAGRLGPDDNFFACGGDSLLAVTVVNRAAEAGVEIPLPLLFQHPTARQLAAHLGEGWPDGLAGAVGGPLVTDMRARR